MLADPILRLGSESGSQPYARIKGRTEAHLTELLGDRAFHFRPQFNAPAVPRPAARAKWVERAADTCLCVRRSN